MKKIILTVFALIATTFIYSQENKDDEKIGFSKGNIILGGDIKYISLSTSDSASLSPTSLVGPNCAFFIFDKVAIEWGVAFGHDTSHDTTESKTYSNFSVGARYYVLDLKNRFKTYTSFAWNWGSSESGSHYPTYQQLIAGVGVNYFFNSKVIFNLGIGDIISYKSTKDASNSTSEFNVNLNKITNVFNQPRFGVSYKLN
jgi:hypothetical protein